MARVLSSPLAVLIALLLVASCTNGQVQPDHRDEPEDRPPPSFRLAILTDLHGQLEPCGCTSRPLGGIDKMAAQVRELRKGDAPVALLTAGDVLFGPGKHGATKGGAAQQELWKAETVVDVLGELELAAATPGRLDVSYGTDTFARLAREAEFPWLAAGIRVGSGKTAANRDGGTASPDAGPKSGDAGAGVEAAPTLLSGHAVIELGELRVGLVGASWMQGPAGQHPEGITFDRDPLDAAKQAADALRSEVNVLVALVSGSRRHARRVAQGIEGLDFVVQSGLSEEDPIPPISTGGPLIVHAGRQGQGLLVVDAWRRGGGGWTDVGPFARRAERERLRDRARELEGKIAEWENADDVRAEDVQGQRKRLRDMRKRIERLETRPPLPDEGNAVAVRYEQLAPEDEGDPGVAKLVDQYFQRVNQHNKKAFADLQPEPAPEGQPSYVGSAACADCHPSEYDWWDDTQHGNAYSTLAERHKQFNLDCVGCHVTGYNEPGGSTVTHVETLKNVGCESCHGPGSAHVDSPSPDTIQRDAPESVCVDCHNEEHSDLFHYRAYRQVLIMPGHGKE